MTLLRYTEDSRSIPTLGGSEGVVNIPPQARFSVMDRTLMMEDPENGNGTVSVTTMQYRVQVSVQW